MSKSAKLPQVRIDPKMKGRLERLAVDDGRSLTGYVRWVLAQHLKSVECLRELASEKNGQWDAKLGRYKMTGPVTVWASGDESDEAKRPNS